MMRFTVKIRSGRFKGHLAVSTKSQYTVGRLMSSGNLSDSKAAIPLLKKIVSIMPKHFTTTIFDAGYDYEPIYKQALAQTMRVVIKYNIRNESEYLGFDEYFRPICVSEHSYCYDSFDDKYNRLKYTRPKECASCPLRDDSLCQKVFKIKFATDIRKYTYPARGSEFWEKFHKERTAVERVNAYLKQ
ncbi:transposase [Lysinibacillus sphaericus]|nr:transposase [Lysinibacillus sphaericus]